MLLRVQVRGGGVLGLPEAGDVPLGRARRPRRAQQLRGSHGHPDGSRRGQAGPGAVERGQPRRAAGLRQRALRSPRGHHEVLREQWPEGHVSGLECHHRSAHVPVPQEPLQPHGDVLVGEAAGHDPPAHSHCRLALHPRSHAVNRHPSGIPPGLTHRLGLISALLAAVSPLEMHMLPL